MTRFEYSSLGKELKVETNIAKKQYQGLGEAFITNKDNKNVSLFKKENKKYNKPNLIYDRLSFYSCSNDKKFDSFFLKSKYSCLLSFYDDLQKLINLKPTKLDKIKEKEKVYKTVSELYNNGFENYYDEYNKLSEYIKK